MEQDKIKEIVAQRNAESQKVNQFMAKYLHNRNNEMSPLVAFDSATATNEVDLPTSLQSLFDSSLAKSVGVSDIQKAVFDGLEHGINEYKRRNGGDTPKNYIIQAAFDSVANTFKSEFKNEPFVQKALGDLVAFDSASNLNTSHHASMGIVPAMVMVTMMNNIANALPIVAQLPNSNGSNEVPVIFGKSIANKRWGALNVGDDIDGKKSGLPYLENRFTVLMTKAGAKFNTPIHTGIKIKPIDGKANVHFEADTDTPKAPFLGGAVVVLVNGVPVADDRNNQNINTKQATNIQAINGEAVEIWDETSQSVKKFFVKSGKADLINHTIEVEFDGENDNHIPDDKVIVEAEIVFDYEAKDDKGEYVLIPPGIDMSFVSYSIFARPSRVKSDISIDAVTQMQNELNIPWQAAVLGVTQQKYMVEQTARLLRESVNSSRLNPNKVTVHNGYKAGVQNTSLAVKFSEIIISIGKAKSKQANTMNMPIAGVDVFVGIKTAPLFNALPADIYTPTGLSYGDNSSIYRIGSFNDGTNVYFVPESFGVADKTGGIAWPADVESISKQPNTDDYFFVQIPKVFDPAKAPFVGHTAVAPIVRIFSNDNSDTIFEYKTERYARIAAEHNPNPRYRHQMQIVLLKNMPIV